MAVPFSRYLIDPLPKRPDMSCHVCTVCSRSPTSRRPFYCSTCARNQLYQLRVDNAQILLEKEYVRRQVEAIVISGNGHGEEEQSEIPASDLQESSRRWSVHATHNKESQSSARRKAITERIESLKASIREKRSDIVRRKAALAQRHSDVESANYQFAERRNAVLTGIQNNIKRTEHLWHALHNKTAESRIFLCREAASLYGLRQNIKKRNGELKESYAIGGMTIFDLRELNSASPTQLSTAFCNVAHLLVLVSHYLSLRLPAEITLPHRNYPAPTILPPAASYLSRDVIFPGTSPSHSSSTSPTASRTMDARPTARPRPLYTDRTLPKLIKEDPVSYALLLEGACLLAWNISWLCRTQGINVGSDSWEGVCDIGKNMWHLLVAPSAQASTVVRVHSGPDVQSKLKPSRDSPRTSIQRTKSFPMLGHFSHGTSHSFLGAVDGTEFMRTWKLPTPLKIYDRLKSVLLGEMASAEWELLEKEWDDAVEDQSQPTVSHPVSQSTTDSILSGVTDIKSRVPENTTTANERIATQVDADRAKGTSGWTKVKSR
ncbi:hypothetical protein Plec18167_008584 [Paecilomyces lecythidis]|uniref:Autophagy-related protein 14 n=1 Tax=Paecilomyces lecythidis TaxID=3004212 RepID=A0ABR3WVT3_9EURO